MNETDTDALRAILRSWQERAERALERVTAIEWQLDQATDDLEHIEEQREAARERLALALDAE